MKNKEEFWLAHVEAWKASAMSQKRYCGQHRLAVSTFQWWHKRLKARRTDSSLGALVAVPVEIARSSMFPGSGAVVRIQAGQFTIEVERGFDREVLAGVLDVLGSR